MNRATLDKKIALLQWFSSLEDEGTINELVEIMRREELILAEFNSEKTKDTK